MKIIVTHHSPDLDAITSVWLLKRFLPGWEEAKVKFVPAGERWGAEVAHENFSVPQLSRDKAQSITNRIGARQDANSKNFVDSPHPVIENINDNEVIHVDTGLGPLDHHQTESDKVSAASLTLDFVQRGINPSTSLRAGHQPSTLRLRSGQAINKDKREALKRMIRVVVEIDHFKEALWPETAADYHEFSLHGILEGFRAQYPNKETQHAEFIIRCLDSLLHNFENRIWAEKEIKKGIGFRVKGLPAGRQGIAFETINDTVLPLAQKMGYVIVVRKDPRKGYVRIKVRPDSNIDLTPVYKKLKKLDSQATWFLHVSKKMLLNGTAKNPTMKPTKLSLAEIIEVLKNI